VVAYDRDGVPSAYGSQRDGEIWLEVPDVATFHLPPGKASLTAIPAELADSEAVLDAYYGTALPLVVQATRGLEVLHGSAVLVPPRGCVIAFCGMSESGKSTVAYGLAARGHCHWADDAVAFRVNGAHSLNAVGLPFTIKLRESTTAYFRASGADAGPVSDAVEEFRWTSARLGAVFLLEPLDRTRSGETAVQVERLGPGEALHALLPNAFRFRPQTVERRRETMRSYLELVACVPIFRARFSRRVDRLGELLDELERRVHEVA
jgi:hypothetical protein